MLNNSDKSIFSTLADCMVVDESSVLFAIEYVFAACAFEFNTFTLEALFDKLAIQSTPILYYCNTFLY